MRDPGAGGACASACQAGAGSFWGRGAAPGAGRGQRREQARRCRPAASGPRGCWSAGRGEEGRRPVPRGAAAGGLGSWVPGALGSPELPRPGDAPGCKAHRSSPSFDRSGAMEYMTEPADRSPGHM